MSKAEDLREDEFEELFRRYFPQLRSFFYRRGTDSETASDLAQETMLRVYRYRVRRSEQYSMTTYIFKVALNLWKNHLRSRGAMKRSGVEVPLGGRDAEESWGELLQAAGQDPFEDAAANEQYRLLWEAIEALPDNKRRVITLYAKGYKYREIANLLAMSDSSVRVSIYRIRQELKLALQR